MLIRLMSGIKKMALYKLYRTRLHCDPIFAARFRRWKKYLPNGCRVLEIGPGGGAWSIELLNRDNAVTVIDKFSDSLDRLRFKVDSYPISNKRIEIICSDAQSYKSDMKFDQIIIFEVLEHIKNDKAVILNLANLLRKGGKLLISTPSDDYKPFYGEEGLDHKEEGGHVRKGYSFKDFEGLFNGTGLKLVFKDSCAGFFTQKISAFGRILRCRFNMINIFVVGVIFFLRWVCWFDFLCPAYPKYVNFIIAEKIDE
ncbi:MAG: class I SAM-dependent methyltransferase [Candidatus Omnitrophota bacterium]